MLWHEITIESESTLFLEFKSRMTTRECYINRLEENKWSLDVTCYGQYDPCEYYDSLDELLDELVNEWSFDKKKIGEVREACLKLKY